MSFWADTVAVVTHLPWKESVDNIVSHFLFENSVGNWGTTCILPKKKHWNLQEILPSNTDFVLGGKKNKKECIVLFTSNNHHYVIQPSDPCYFYPNVIFVIPVIDCFSVLTSNSSCQIFQQPDNPLFSLFLVPIFIKITKQVSYLWDRGQLPFPSGHCSQNQHTEQLSSLENLQDTRCHN